MVHNISKERTTGEKETVNLSINSHCMYSDCFVANITLLPRNCKDIKWLLYRTNNK